MNSQQLHTLPEGWEMKRLGNLVTKVGSGITPKGGRETYLTEGVPIVRSQNVVDGRLNLADVAFISHDQHQKMKATHLKAGDLLLNITGASIGRTCVVPDDFTQGNVNQHVCIIRLNIAKSDAYYLNSFLSSRTGQNLIDSYQAGGGRQGLNFEQIKAFLIPLPPLPEQRQIAAVLGTWDRAIEQTTDLLRALRLRHRGLMQRLLTGKVRLPGFDGEWQAVNANEVFRNVSIRNHPNEPLLSATQERGIIPRSMLEGRVTMPEGETGGYKLVVPGDFIISLRSFQGGIETSDYRGVVSPAYTVLKPKVAIDDNFYRHYFKSIRFIRQLGVAVIGIRDGKQISFEDFSVIRIPKPELNEQRAIAQVLDASMREIRQQETKLDALRVQKRGLMQSLLTGRIRVPDAVLAVQEAV